MLNTCIKNIVFFLSTVISWVELLLWNETFKNVKLIGGHGKTTLERSIFVGLLFTSIYSFHKFLVKRVKIHKFNLLSAILSNIYIFLCMVFYKYFDTDSYINFKFFQIELEIILDIILIPFAFYSIHLLLYKDKEVENK